MSQVLINRGNRAGGRSPAADADSTHRMLTSIAAPTRRPLGDMLRRV